MLSIPAAVGFHVFIKLTSLVAVWFLTVGVLPPQVSARPGEAIGPQG
jgi:hypothetical protein